MAEHYVQEIVIPRRVAFGPGAVQKIPYICEDIGIKKLAIFSGKTYTKKITSDVIIPQIEDSLDFSHYTFPENVELEYLHSKAKEIKKDQSYLMVVGGGKVIDYVKVIASLTNSEYLDPARRADPTRSRPLILQLNTFGIFYLYLLPTLKTIRLHFLLPPF